MKFAKKSLGQNFLIDKNIIKKIINSVDIKNKNVVEIGPGKGALTEEILKNNPKSLTLIEKDNSLFESLSLKFSNYNFLKFYNEDILNLNVEKIIKEETIIFGNLPYNISSQILVKFILDNNFKFRALMFMFQKEMANRILAKVNSKDYGRLSILSNWKFRVKKLFDIKPGSFNPRPKVESSILLFIEKTEKFPIGEPKNLEKITRILFNQRRKKIRKSINYIFKNNKKIINSLNLNLDLRPQNLDVKTYCNIASKYKELKTN